MGLFDKVKNLFTEEVEEDEPIKKEVIQVEIPSPKETKKEKRVVEESVVLSELPKEEVISVKEEKEEYKFPFFDDEDFEVIEERRETRKENKQNLYKGKKDNAYNPPASEKHEFKPTPIISPVYGILDKNYVKEDIRSRNVKPLSYYNPKEATIDEIRNKAYGSLEDEVVNQFDYEDRALFEPVDTDELFVEMEREKPAVEEESFARHAAPTGKKDDELTSLLEEEMSKDSTDSPAKISDKELFSLIDSMYERGDK